MKIEEYHARLTELGRARLPWAEYDKRATELKAEYLAEQTVPNVEEAIKLILFAQERGDLPEWGASVSLEDWRKCCELLKLLNDTSPDNRWWRCRMGDCVVDVSAETGEVYWVSV